MDPASIFIKYSAIAIQRDKCRYIGGLVEAAAASSFLMGACTPIKWFLNFKGNAGRPNLYPETETTVLVLLTFNV